MEYCILVAIKYSCTLSFSNQYKKPPNKLMLRGKKFSNFLYCTVPCSIPQTNYFVAFATPNTSFSSRNFVLNLADLNTSLFIKCLVEWNRCVNTRSTNFELRKCTVHFCDCFFTRISMND